MTDPDPSDTVRVAAIQMPHGDTLETNLQEAERWLRVAHERGVQVALLPEYFFMAPDHPPQDAAPKVRELLERLSRRLPMTLAANVIESRNGTRANIGVVYEAGRETLAQVKIHPMPRETADGIEGGSDFGITRIQGHTAGMLVCADILYPEAARILGLHGAELLFNPVMSSFHAVDPTRDAREAMYVARAYDAAAFVVKAGGFRRGTIVGRSLIAAPWGLLAHYRDEFAPEVLVADLDFAQLARFRDAQRRFPPRRPAAYGALTRPEDAA